MSDWIEWKGGKRPVPKDTVVEVKTRGGGGRVVAGTVRWGHAAPPEDIVAYRVVEHDEQPVSRGGVKHDQGEPLTGLMLQDFARALEAVATVTTFGAQKYSPSGWLAVPEAERRYTDALCRHLLADLRGEAADSESGLPHLAHAAWNVLALLELRSRGRTD